MRLRAKTRFYSAALGHVREGAEFEVERNLGLSLLEAGMAEEVPGGKGSSQKPVRRKTKEA